MNVKRPARIAQALCAGILAACAALASCATGESDGRAGAVRPGGFGGDDASLGAGGVDGGVLPILVVDASLPDVELASDVVTMLSISPADPVLDVTLVDGKVTQITSPNDGGSPLTFRATANGSTQVSASWSINRGELGTLGVATGEFAPDGAHCGVATVTASHAGATATTTVTVRVHTTWNGAPPDYDPKAGGVGGEGLGSAVDVATIAGMRAAKQPPSGADELGWLYPYDGTVWPRGTLAPLLQWQTTRSVSSVYIHLTQQNFELEGFYGGVMLVRQPIDPSAWQTALNGNGGDKLHVELTIATSDGNVGPIAQDWIVAPGPLRGTVYYNSYDTAFAKPMQNKTGAAVLAIKPGAAAPVLAIAGAGDKCIVCHTVSDDGSTLFAQIANATNHWDYADGASFDMKNGGAQIAAYTGSAPDGTTNNRKFLWSAVAKDGTYALASVGGVQPESFGGPLGVYRRDDGSALAATGLENFSQIVAPSFSRDGKHVAFDLWIANGLYSSGYGGTLDVMDAHCTLPTEAGSASCGSIGFSNVRRLLTSTLGTVGWPAWLPDSSALVFHQALNASDQLATWRGAQAQIWFVDVPSGAGVTVQPIPLSALNGIDAQGNSVLPKVPGVVAHDADHLMSYEPTVNPIVSGGYNWVVFTSRRAYGNVLTDDPFEDQYQGPRPFTKKLWVAAVDLKRTPGKDPSHPAFYLPGQELLGANMRGFWVVDPCRSDGQSCETGDECCGGYCRPSEDGGGLVCGQKPTGCAQEYEKCDVNSDCCGVTLGYECINGFCAEPQPAPPR
jgi:hypothetical protein